MPKPATPIYTKEELESLQYLKGKMGQIEYETMQIAVKILEIRRRFGHVDALVTPDSGKGEKWIALHKVKV
ncbi:MAG: hypothetical protein ACO3CH_00045 [Ilumatobacteraceae bacterium]|jgi:hypothetical protein